MKLERITLCLNTDDPEQKELHEFITLLPNGKKRNASSFLRTLVDREYQKKKEQYMVERQKMTKEKKETPQAPQVEVKIEKPKVNYIPKSS